MRVGLCAVMRDEAAYLPEWLAWHRRMGVGRFWLYDTGSEDGSEVLAGRAEDAVVVAGWPHLQADAYAEVLAAQAVRPEVDWVAFVDLDEFLWHPDGLTLPEVLGQCGDALAVYAPPRTFGFGGVVRRPASQLRAYRWRLPDDHAWHRDGGKAVVRTGVDVAILSPSRVETQEEPVRDTGLLVNHYYTRSVEECVARRLCRQSRFTGHASWEQVLEVAEAATVWDDRLARLAEAGR